MQFQRHNGPGARPGLDRGSAGSVQPGGHRPGDVPTGIVLGEAARAARFGVEPTVVPIQFGEESLRYRAFVAVVDLPAMGPLPATTIRSLVAVTGEGESAKVLMVATPANAATIVGPPTAGGTRPDPFTSAMAVYGEGPNGARWVGTSGSVRIVEQSSGGDLPECAPARHLLHRHVRGPDGRPVHPAVRPGGGARPDDRAGRRQRGQAGAIAGGGQGRRRGGGGIETHPPPFLLARFPSYFSRLTSHASASHPGCICAPAPSCSRSCCSPRSRWPRRRRHSTRSPSAP